MGKANIKKDAKIQKMAKWNKTKSAGEKEGRNAQEHWTK